MALWKINIFILLFLPILLMANADELSEKLFAKYEKIETLEADVSQKNYWGEQDIEQISQGKLYYNSENILLEYSRPEGQKLLVQRNDIFIYDKQSNQLIKSKITNEMNKFKPIEILKYYWYDNEIEMTKEDGKFNIELLPQTTDFNKITAIIDSETYLIEEIKYLDNQKNVVEFRFTNQKINKKIPQEKFELEVPEDVNIIEN